MKPAGRWANSFGNAHLARAIALFPEDGPEKDSPRELMLQIMTNGQEVFHTLYDAR